VTEHDRKVRRIDEPVRIEAAGVPPKLISEFVGRVATATDSVSIAVMESPTGWSEPGQTPDFDEYSLVLIRDDRGRCRAGGPHTRRRVGAVLDAFGRRSTLRLGLCACLRP
jgi:hypothetical protein